jgi:hypothetical protein
MKLEFSTKLNSIRERRRLRGELERLERENNKNEPKKEDINFKKNTSKDSMEDKKILLQKLYFINNESSRELIKKNIDIPILSMKKQTDIKNENNAENISIIVSEIIPHAKIKFYE